MSENNNKNTQLANSQSSRCWSLLPARRPSSTSQQNVNQCNQLTESRNLCDLPATRQHEQVHPRLGVGVVNHGEIWANRNKERQKRKEQRKKEEREDAMK